MATVKNGDFVEIDFIGRIKSTGVIFDLTDEEEAKKQGVFQPGREFKPVVFCIGANQMIKGLDEALPGKKIGDEFEIEVPPEKGFGKKNPKLIQMIPLQLLKKQGVNPTPGQTLNLDGVMAKVRSVSSGRVIIDFNHPLAGQELVYSVKINKFITNKKLQIESIAKLMNIPITVSEKNKEFTVKIESKLEPQLDKVFRDEIKKRVKDIKIKFS